MKTNQFTLLVLFFVLLAFLGSYAGCDCGDDDDDNDDSGPGGGGSGDCQAACEGVFECGGNLWYENLAECNDLCGEWLTTGVDCAECFIACWTVDDGCIEAGLCMTDCAVGACAQWLAEL